MPHHKHRFEKTINSFRFNIDNVSRCSNYRQKASDTLKDHQVKTIQEVIINGKKPIVENKVDKIVYNVANDVTSQSGAAIDVLRKVPQVTVDADGNVELQGNPNVRFLINGKPSSIFGNSLADALASIPASQIKSIEAVTSPERKQSKRN